MRRTTNLASFLSSKIWSTIVTAFVFLIIFINDKINATVLQLQILFSIFATWLH